MVVANMGCARTETVVGLVQAPDTTLSEGAAGPRYDDQSVLESI
jgi:hypothetical protein